MSTQFLNVDLEVGSKARAKALIDELSRKLFVLYDGPLGKLQHAHFETNKPTGTADATIRELVRVLDAASPAARRLWRAAKVRDFNIGIECGQEPFSFELGIEPATVSSVARLGGRIVVTVYAPERPPARRRKTSARGRSKARRSRAKS